MISGGTFAASADVGFEFFVANFSQVFIWALSPPAPSFSRARINFSPRFTTRAPARTQKLARISPPTLSQSHSASPYARTHAKGTWMHVRYTRRYRTCILLYLHARYARYTPRYTRICVCIHTCLDCATTSCEPILSLGGEETSLYTARRGTLLRLYYIIVIDCSTCNSVA